MEAPAAISSDFVKYYADEYLRELAKCAPSTTYESHKQSIRSFCSWYDSKDISQQDLQKSVILYLETEVRNSHCTSTVSGRVCTLANLLAYSRKTDPELEKIRLLRELQLRSQVVVSQLMSKLISQAQTSCSPAGSTEAEIEAIISHLRQSHYGTRIHAFVETVLSTKGRPGTVRAVDISDVDLEKRTAEIEISNTHVVGSLDLVQSRVVSLDESSVSALREYIKNNMYSKSSDPLFATPQGRVSQSTLRRSLSQVSENASKIQDFNGQSTESGNSPKTSPKSSFPTVYPSDIWWYAVQQFFK